MYTQVADLESVTMAFEAARIEVTQSRAAYLPKTKKTVVGRDAEVCLNLAEALDEHDDVQNVFSDFDVSDDEMRRIGGE